MSNENLLWLLLAVIVFTVLIDPVLLIFEIVAVLFWLDGKDEPPGGFL